MDIKSISAQIERLLSSQRTSVQYAEIPSSATDESKLQILFYRMLDFCKEVPNQEGAVKNILKASSSLSLNAKMQGIADDIAGVINQRSLISPNTTTSSFSSDNIVAMAIDNSQSKKRTVTETDDEVKKKQRQETSETSVVLDDCDVMDTSSGEVVSIVKKDSHLEKSLFALTNLGSIRLRFDGLTLSSSDNVFFVIEALEKIVCGEDLSEDEKMTLANLIKQYKSTHEVSRLIDSLSSKRNPEAFFQLKQTILLNIYTYLEKDRVFYFPSGYQVSPSGHSVMIKLSLLGDLVCAEVINRGEGANVHGVDFSRESTFSTINLPEIPYEVLKNSRFLSLLLELNLTKIPSEEVCNDKSKDTDYSISDFYRIVFEQWPSKESSFLNLDSARGLQRGGVCSFKQFITPIRSLVSRNTEKRIKLALRCLSLERFLNHKNLSRYSEYQIRWACAKISKTCLDPEVALPKKEKDEASALIRKAEARLVSLSEEIGKEGHLKMTGLSLPIKDVKKLLIEKADKKKEARASNSSITTQENETKFGVSLYEVMAELRQCGNSQDYVKTLSFFKKLPLATDPAWIEGCFDDVGNVVRQESCLFFVKDIIFSLLEEKKYNVFVDDIALMANALVGVMLREAAITTKKEGVDNEKSIQNPFLIQEMNELYYVLSLSMKQLRIYHPENNKFLLAAVQSLKPFFNKNNLPTFSFSQSEVSIKFSSLSKERFHENFVMEMAYQELKKLDEESLKETIALYRKNMNSNVDPSTEELAFYLIYGNITKLIPSISEYTPPMNASFDLIMALSGFHLNQYSVRHFLSAPSSPSMTVIRTAIKPSEKPFAGNALLYKNPNINTGVLCRRVYNFNSEEALLFVPCLDDRIIIKQENARISYCYNAQIKNVIQGGLSSLQISDQEHILLKLMSLYDSLTIPLWIHYLSQYPKRLESPLFGALMEAFLLNRQDSLKLDVLSFALADSNSQIAEHFLDFLESLLKKIQKSSSMHQTRNVLLRILARSYSQLCLLKISQSGEARKTRLKTTLISRLQKTIDNTPTKNDMFSIISLYPYIKHDKDLKVFCGTALQNSTSSYSRGYSAGTPSQFICDLEEGFEALSKDVLPTDRLPIVIFKEISYVLTEKSPVVNLLGRVYSFNDGGVKTILTVNLDDSYILEKEFKNLDGTFVLFTYHKSLYDCLKSVPREFLSSSGISDHARFDCWASITAKQFEIRICESGKSLAPIYYIKKDCIVKGDDLHLFFTELGDSTDLHPLLQRLLYVAEAEDILTWKNAEGEVQLIEFPCYGFSLRNEKNEGSSEVKWRFDHPDFYDTYLDFSFHIEELEPYSHYLPLIDSLGKNVVVMPNRSFQPNHVDFFGEKSPKGIKSNMPELIRLDVGVDKNLIAPIETKSLIVLFFLFLYSKNYEEASHMLKQLALHPCQWGEGEGAVIREHFSLRKTSYSELDKHPQACILRIKLLCLGISMEVINCKTPDLLSSLRGDYDVCVNQKKHGTLNALSDMEFEVVKLYLVNSEPQLSNSSVKVHRNDDFVLRSIVNDKFITEISNNLEVMLLCMKSPKLATLEMRPRDLLVSNFLYYYKIATEGDKSSVFELKKFIELGISSKEERSETLCRYIISNILDCRSLEIPHKFSSVNENITKLEFVQFIRDVREEVSRISKLKAFEVVNKITEARKTDYFSVLAKTPPVLAEKSTFPPTKIVFPSYTSLPSEFTLDDSKKVQQKILPYLNLIPQVNQQKEIKEQLLQIYAFETNDPCIASSCATTKEGIIRFFTEMPAAFALQALDSQNIHAILSKDIAELSCSLKEIRASLERILQTYLIDEMLFKEQMGLLKKLTLKEAIVAFAQDNDLGIAASNPSLIDKLQEVKGLIATYLKEKTEHQHLIRTKNLFDLIEKASSKEENQIAKQNFLTSLNAERAYDKETPFFQALLAFEALGNLRLRKEQVCALVEMVNDTTNSIELEARTGFGKSQVLIPLWLFLTSRKKTNLVIMAVPSSLLLDQERHLKKLLGDSLSTGIGKVVFSRGESSNLNEVKKLLVKLLDAMANQRIILVDIGSLHGMTTLALKEALFKQTTSPSQYQMSLVEELGAITKLIKFKASVFIDESRESLNPKQHYDYAVGAPNSVEKPLCEEMFFFWLGCFFSSEIQNKWNFDFQPLSVSLSKKTLTQENFPELQDDLALALVNNMEAAVEIKAILKDHLKGGSFTVPVQEVISRFSYAEQRQYAFCRLQISSCLKKSLLKTCGERYDLNEKLIAFPYERGIPKPSSEFATVNDVLNFTIQANLKKGIQEKTVLSYINSIQELYLKNADFVFNPNYVLFQEMRQCFSLPPLEEMEDVDIKKLTDCLNTQDIRLRLSFITHWILPQVTLFPGKISGTSFQLLSRLDRVHAASGTVDPDILPPKMKSRADPTAPIGNLVSIYLNSKIEEIPERPEEALSCLLKKYEEGSPPIIIDVGGNFLDLDEKRMLDLFFANNKYIEGVTYYDQNGKCLLKMRGSSSSIPRERASLDIKKIGIFIRQGNAIGSDTPMPVNAKGMVTLKHQTTENFFLQGAGRMRGLTSGQTLDIAITKSDAKLIDKANELTIPSLLKHLKIQEGKEKGLNYFFGLKLFLESLVENSLWQAHSVDDLLQRFALMEDLIVTSSFSNPLAALYQTRGDCSAVDAVKYLKESLLKPLKEKNLPFVDVALIEKAFDEHVKYNKLPLVIAGGDNETEESITEAEKDIDQNQDMEQERLQENTQDNSLENRVINFQALAPAQWNGNYIDLFENNYDRVFSGIFVYFSPNFSCLSIDPQTPVHKCSYLYLLQTTPDGMWKVMALDLHDTDKVISFMKTQPKQLGSGNKHYLLSHGRIIITDDSNAPIALSKDLTYAKLTLLNKILSGDSSLDYNEVQFLRNADVKTSQDIRALVDEFRIYWPSLSLISSFLPQLNEVQNEESVSKDDFNDDLWDWLGSSEALELLEELKDK